MDILDTESDTLVKGPDLTEERCFGGAVAIDNTVWVVGGIGCKTVESLTLDTTKDLASNVWNGKHPMPPAKRRGINLVSRPSVHG